MKRRDPDSTWTDYPSIRAALRRERSIDSALQAAIFVLSLSAIWMLNEPGPWTRWAPVIGMASQPFWIAATWRARQHGMLLLAVIYCVPWARGIYLNFF